MCFSGQFACSGRGLLNGPPPQWIEEPAELRLDYGITGFILAADSALAIERFGTEIDPATRQLVATERARRSIGR